MREKERGPIRARHVVGSGESVGVFGLLSFFLEREFARWR